MERSAFARSIVPPPVSLILARLDAPILELNVEVGLPIADLASDLQVGWAFPQVSPLFKCAVAEADDPRCNLGAHR